MRNKIINLMKDWFGTSRNYLDSSNEFLELHRKETINFATWLQDNYSTNDKQGSTNPLPKGYWREDFTDNIHHVSDLLIIFENKKI